MNSFVLLSSAAFGLPAVQAKAPETGSSNDEVVSTKKVKPSSLPLYPAAENLEYSLQPPSKVEAYVRDARVQATKIKQEYQPVLDQVSHIVSTGKAHTTEAMIQLRDEENLVGRIGFMAAGGLLGLVAARRGRFLKKITYLSLGLAGTGSICYPKEAKVYAANAGCFAARNARIAYHFVVGTRPTIQNENGKAFDKMANMVSDVWQWGFRLFEKKETEVKLAEDFAPQEVVQIKADKSVAQSSEEPEPIKAAEDTVFQSNETVTIADAPEAESNVPSNEPSVITEEIPVEPPTEILLEETIKNPAETVSHEPTAETQVEADAGSEAKPALEFEGDLGQGNPEDKELYTTRE